jgi:hypothetical protein
MSDQATARSGTSECQACPICMGLAALRQSRPELVEHLAKAGAELLLAVRAVLDGATAPDGRGQRHTRGGVQHIDIA